MDTRLPAWALVLLLCASVMEVRGQIPAAREKLCGPDFLRALVRACGGPLWPVQRRSLVRESGDAADRELYQWQARRNLIPRLEAHEDPAAPRAPQQPGSRSSPRQQPRKPLAVLEIFPQHCCDDGCTKQELLTYCPR